VCFQGRYLPVVTLQVSALSPIVTCICTVV
jgi:hypothetical protein